MMVAIEIPHTIQSASIGIPDTLLLMLLALVVFGPRRLPEIGRQIGKLMYEFRKVSNDFKYQMEEELRASEEADRLKKLQALTAATPAVADSTIPALPEAAGATTETVPSASGEVRSTPEIPRLPQLQPPSVGEKIAAEKPFRAYVEAAENMAVVPPQAALTGDQATGTLAAPDQEAHHA